MKFLLIYLMMSSTAWACWSMKRNPEAQGLQYKVLCQASDQKDYDYSFGQQLRLSASGLSARLRIVNAHFISLQLTGGVMNADFRDLQGAGSFDNQVFNDSDFGFADLRNFNLTQVRFENSRFRGANLKGLDLRKVEFLDCDLAGAIIDVKTKLPFSTDEALAKGMVIR